MTYPNSSMTDGAREVGRPEELRTWSTAFDQRLDRLSLTLGGRVRQVPLQCLVFAIAARRPAGEVHRSLSALTEQPFDDALVTAVDQTDAGTRCEHDGSLSRPHHERFTRSRYNWMRPSSAGPWSNTISVPGTSVADRPGSTAWVSPDALRTVHVTASDVPQAPDRWIRGVLRDFGHDVFEVVVEEHVMTSDLSIVVEHDRVTSDRKARRQHQASLRRTSTGGMHAPGR